MDDSLSEYWHDVKGYEGLYQVSNLGRVKSIGGKSNHRENIIMKQQLILGYKCVGLTKKNQMKIKKVHRLVADAFLPKIKGKNQVNHIDGNKRNNCLYNLEWCDAKENINHAFKIGLKKNKKGIENKNSIQVQMIDKNTNKVIMFFGSLREAERETGVTHSNIQKSIKRNGTAGGFKWKII